MSCQQGKEEGLRQRKVFPLWRERTLEEELSNIQSCQ